MTAHPQVEARRPDFVVIGAMKAGTTTLFRWLDTHPDCQLSPVKEPHFFSRDLEYERGQDHYLALFAAVPARLLTGEASASYADPRIADVVAARMHALAPEAKLVYLVREPVARLKSHYLHEWQRSRERRPLLTALADPDNPYAACSRYLDAVAPFRSAYGDAGILVADLGEFATTSGVGWNKVTEFLGLPPHDRPEARANVSSGKMAFNPMLLKLWESGLLERARRLPGPVRRAGRVFAGRSTQRLQHQAELVSATSLPAELVEELTLHWHGVLDHSA